MGPWCATRKAALAPASDDPYRLAVALKGYRLTVTRDGESRDGA